MCGCKGLVARTTKTSLEWKVLFLNSHGRRLQEKDGDYIFQLIGTSGEKMSVEKEKETQKGAVCECAGCKAALAERGSRAGVGQSEQRAGCRASRLGQWLSWRPGLGLEHIGLLLCSGGTSKGADS